ncbi:TetR family transcriptional regulator [Tamaricihabitans halophyticus]|uniref:TetR family transcriptional regulator n=1 Tax=Tamaricihabitans halophyticus TaxID=1262583 RepID=A0A4V2SUE1_9PSEU|nr:TetR family transcriptional regulator [Tamaricihabitans halophyticus]TCP54176.1 TetR family transcriptional regulator [Tamaricihabitans halophyticus]
MTSASTPKGERRRNELIDAAAALLAEGGFDAVRHRAVSERAGLPLASTTYYFDSLDELITAAVERHGRNELDAGARRLDELAARHRGVDTVVELMLEQLLGPEPADSAADLDGVLLRYERLVGTGRRPYLRSLSVAMSDEMDALLLEICERSGMPVSLHRLKQLIALVDGAVVNALVEVNPEPRAAARKMLSEALQPTA